jgi:hypothetical protein
MTATDTTLATSIPGYRAGTWVMTPPTPKPRSRCGT